jgi:hypothetical protein
MTEKVDAEVKKQIDAAHTLLDELLTAKDIGQATTEHMPELTEIFVEVLKGELNTADQKKDQARLDKLQQIIAVLQQASQPSAEIALIEEMLSAPDSAAIRNILEENKEAIDDEFLQLFANLVNQAQTQKQDPQVVEKLQDAYRSALRFSMETKLKG